VELPHQVLLRSRPAAIKATITIYMLMDTHSA
jgi:hypothetical protein